MEHYRGSVGRTFWFFLTGDIGTWGWEAYLDHCNRMLDEHGDGLLVIAYQAMAPSLGARRKIARLVRARTDDFGHLRGFALAADSRMHRLAVQAINWVVDKPFTERVFADPVQAATWLDVRGARGTECLAQASQMVPPELWWQGLAVREGQHVG